MGWGTVRLDQLLIEAHQANPYGKLLSVGQAARLHNDPETVALATQHLMFVTAALEKTVKVLADAIDASPRY